MISMSRRRRMMEFGISLPTYPEGATVEGFVAVAQVAERLGYTSAWTTDHVIMPPEQAGPYASIFEPLMVLAYLAAQTATVRLGISVIVVPQRNGIVLAKELATLDHLSGGRLVVGVGAGWNEAEFRMLDADRRFHQRGAYLDETILVWRHLWTDPSRPFSGTFYDLPEVAFGPLPLTAGGPPIWVGGSSAAARRRAGRSGEAWHPVNIPASDIESQFAVVRQAAEQAGRTTPIVAPRLSMQFGTSYGGPVSASGARAVEAATSDEMIEKLNAYRNAGASEIVCHFGSPDGAAVVEAMERFAAEVMPAFG
jgi:probable F420-dependent oxidoreductase